MMPKKKPIISKYGQWKYPGQETIIPDANGRITMQGVPYPVFGIDDQGNQQMMMPGQEYKFPGNSVYEIPITNQNIMARGFDRGSGKSTGVAQPTKLTNEQRALDDWQRLTSNGRSTFEKRIPAPDDKTYAQLLSRYNNTNKMNNKDGIFLGAYKQVGGQLVPHDISVPNLSRQDGGGAKRFNTNLRGAELEAFNQHAQQFPSLTTDTGDYDTQGFYKEVYNKNNGDMNAITAALTPGSPTAHVGNDRYKKPNHPTFSKESKYHIPVLRPAGEWGHNEEGNYDYFNASRRNIKNMTESDGTPLDYFKRAEDYNQDGTPDVKLFYKGQPVFKEGGSVKKVKIKSLPKNWKTQ